MQTVNVIGAGLAGSEAAYQIAKRGVPVNLYEMRGVKSTPAHHTDQFAELVCTNSLRGNQITNGAGLLKEEMRRLDSIIIGQADLHAVPAGGALAVDREPFSQSITERIKAMPNVTVHTEVIEEIPSGITVIATGPLTDEKLALEIQKLNGTDGLHFFDAAAPIVTAESIDMGKVYLKSRYNKGEAAYLNCPMDKETFYAFRDALITAEVAELKDFEDDSYFEGCMPVEVMAERGEKTLLFGMMKPVGLEDPRTGKRPYAVVQLRQDNAAASLYNIVGFQTHLKWGEQKRIFQMIPGLENADFVRYGVMHRNTYMQSPDVLLPTYQSKFRNDLFFAGQMTGVEGYVESAASGLIAGINAAKLARSEKPMVFPATTQIGAMAHYITTTSGKHFQPMNANFGILTPIEPKIRDKKARYEAQATQALSVLDQVISESV